jgi:hypothetical protein
MTATIAVVAALAVSASATASPASHHAVGGAIRNGTITVGSNWTLEYSSWHGTDDFCETMSFKSGHVFTGDNASTGTWSGNVVLRFTGGLDFNAGDVYKGKLQKSGAHAGDFVGTVTRSKTSFSPFILVPGALC